MRRYWEGLRLVSGPAGGREVERDVVRTKRRRCLSVSPQNQKLINVFGQTFPNQIAPLPGPLPGAPPRGPSTSPSSEGKGSPQSPPQKTFSIIISPCETGLKAPRTSSISNTDISVTIHSCPRGLTPPSLVIRTSSAHGGLRIRA